MLEAHRNLTTHLLLTDLGCKVSHLALAWIARNPNTSTVILGASKPEQIVDNLKALEVIPKLTPAIVEKVEGILGNKPAPIVRLSLPPYRVLWVPLTQGVRHLCRRRGGARRSILLAGRACSCGTRWRDWGEVPERRGSDV